MARPPQSYICGMPPQLTIENPAPEALRIVSSAEIAAYLQQLHDEQARVLLSNPQGQALQSRICAFNPSTDLLGLEVGADPLGLMEQLVASGEITAAAYLGSVKLQFELEAAVLVSGEDGAVLRSALPRRLYRFQRRQAFRVQPPGSQYPRLLLPLPEDAAADTAPRALRVLDISVGGVALQLHTGFTPMATGELLKHLVLELDRSTSLRVNLQAQHLSEQFHDGVVHAQLGCAFVDLDPDANRSLQVYVDQTQKRRRLLKLTP